MHLKSVWLMFLVSMIAVSQVVHAQDKSPSRIVQALAKQGFKTCAAELDERVKDIHENDNDYAHLVTWNAAVPDKRTVVAVTSSKYSDIGSMVTTFTATLDASGKCSVTSTQVFTSNQSCSAARDKTFAVWKFTGELGATSVYERDEDKRLTIFLTPMQNGGCMILRSAAMYD